MDFQKVLEDIGFQPTEAKIYLYLLKKGPSTQQQISNETKMLRQTVYEIVGKMASKGQVSANLVKKRKVYSIVEPKILLIRFKEKEEELEKSISEMNKIRSKEKPEISSETFIGYEGLKNLFNLTLSSSTEILWIANEEIHKEIFKDYYWENYALKRLASKTPIKLLVENKNEHLSWNTNKKALREVKKSKLVKNLKSSLVLFEDKVILYSMENGHFFGAFIKNKSLKFMLEQMFKQFWEKGETV